VAERRQPNTSPSDPDGEGVRVFPKPGHVRRGARLWGAAALVLVMTAAVWWMLAPSGAPGATSRQPPANVDKDAERAEAEEQRRTTRPGSSSASVDQLSPSSNDPNDLASYFQPGDPEPTATEVIEALHKAGIRSGLGAFNPPGTSPPLEGLAVPDNFDLPPGYVRHHQVTDEGVPIEPILMFAPDVTLYDAKGRPIAKPVNGVVPPELAPPGLPLRWVRVRKQ